MPLRDPTPDELKELGVAIATPTSSTPIAPSTEYDQSIDYKSLSVQQSNEAINATNPLTYKRSPTPTAGENFMLNIGPAMATTALGGSLLQGAIPAASKLAPYANPIGQGLGNAALEGFNYLTQPEENKPSLGGAIARSVAQTGIPIGAGKVAEAVAPLTQKVKPLLSRMSKIPKDIFADIGNAIKEKVAAYEHMVTSAKGEKDILMAGLRDKIPGLPVEDFVARLRAHFNPFAEDETNKLVNQLYKKVGGKMPEIGSIKLDDLQEFVRQAYDDAKPGSLERLAVNKFYKEFLDSTYNHIAAHPNGGPVVAQKFLDLTHETGAVLSIKEAMQKEIGDKSAVGVAQRFMYDKNAFKSLEQLDEIAGTKFAPTIKELTTRATQIEHRNIEVAAGKEANAALVALQKRARWTLYGIAGTIAGLPGGLASGGSAIAGAEFGAWLVNRFTSGGSFAFERWVAHALQGIGKIAPAGTAMVNQATRTPVNQKAIQSPSSSNE